MTQRTPSTPRARAIRGVARTLLLVWLTACALLVLSPTNAFQTQVIWRTGAQLTAWGFPVSFTEAEQGLNVLLFVPWLPLVAASWPRVRLWPWALLGVLTPGAVELVQALLPDRVVSVRDVVCNVAGVLLGGLLALPLRRWARRHA